MDIIKKIASEILTGEEKEFYNDTVNVFVVKTILAYNPSEEASILSLQFDGVEFPISIDAAETKIISGPIATNVIKAKGTNISIHISGIQLGE